MADGQITLFDLRSKAPNHAWSPNPWKTRLLLNYKGLDYKTEWLDYPEIKTRLEGHVPPNTEGFAYTIPTVTLPDGTWIMDSRKIADAIEARHPTPSVHLASPYQARIEAIMPRVMQALVPIIYGQIPKRLLEPRSVEYWNPVRGEKVGMPLDEFEAKNGGEKAYAAAEAPLGEISAMLRENGNGPFLQGREVCYADFVWVAFLEFMRRLGDDIYNEVLARTGARELHERLLEASAPWLKRNDH